VTVMEKFIMTIDDFRKLHSELIEHYQFIELHFEGIYASISNKNFFDSMEDVKNDSMTRLLRTIKRIDESKNLKIFTAEEYDDLESICESRNFWVHNCYVDLAFDRKTGGLKKQWSRDKIYSDIRAAQKARDDLYEKKMSLMEGIK